jgi:hypothetical protein
MAAIFTRVPGADVVEGTLRGRFYDITFDAAYTTTGVAVSPDDAGLVGPIVGFNIVAGATVAGTAPTTFMVPQFDFKNQKIQLFGAAGGANGLTEIANATSLATVVIRAQVLGF